MKKKRSNNKKKNKEALKEDLIALALSCRLQPMASLRLLQRQLLF